MSHHAIPSQPAAPAETKGRLEPRGGAPRGVRGPADKPTVPEMAAVRPVVPHVEPPQRHLGAAPIAPSLAPESAHGRGPLVSELQEDDDVPTNVCGLAERIAQYVSQGRDRASLVRLDGPAAGQAIVLGEGPLRVGRGREADLRLVDDGVSRLHAIVHSEGGGYVIVDAGSRNGTLVRGERVQRRVLVDGDVVQFGPRTTFRFSIMDAQQEELMRQLFESSVRDVLTGAYNRQYMSERIATEIAYAVRHRTNLSVILFDLDHFKRVNDTHGHPAGDAVLKYVAAVVSSRLRAEDVFARYGGEEFVVLLRGIDLAGAARAAERLRGAVAGGATTCDGTLIPITLSAGCASLGCAPVCSGDALLAVADRRLYGAKHAGRNRVVASD